jgi:exopolyphosphatase/guanosine-5'-triphosphate,3'-diphosphate pyrophosphatase
MNKIAVIDCGTNTFNLLVAEITDAGWQVVFQNKLPVKLGEGGFEDRIIRPGRFARGLDALYCHVNNIHNFQCARVYAFATSAIRETTNGRAFVSTAKKLFDLDIEIIEGGREAELIYEGVQLSMDLGAQNNLIMDIGGGSTEFIIANRDEILWKQSFLLGVSRLFEMIRPDDRLAKTDQDYLDKILKQELEPLRDALERLPVKRLIGASGSFDTMLTMHLHKLKKQDEGFGKHTMIPLASFNEIHGWLLRSSLDERIKHPAIPGIRAEYMPLSTCLTNYVLKLCKAETLEHSAFSLKEGAMKEIREKLSDLPGGKHLPAEPTDTEVE